MKIEIVKGYEQVKSREFQRDGKTTTNYSQEAYAHAGGAFPIRFTLSLPDSNGFAVGMYDLGIGAFKVGQYDRLELNSYEMYKHLTLITKNG